MNYATAALNHPNDSWKINDRWFDEIKIFAFAKTLCFKGIK